jgi:hypothetical protein
VPIVNIQILTMAINRKLENKTNLNEPQINDVWQQCGPFWSLLVPLHG